jgi:hypothetical protein
MAENVTTKVELLRDIEMAWSALIGAVNRLTEAQSTRLRDEQGWSVKDHITHMTAWERSVVFLLQHKPRHEGLGVPEEVFLQRDDDVTNAAIQTRHKAQPLSDAVSELRDVHARLLNLIQPLTDEDLHKPYSHFLPNEQRDDDPAVIETIYGNTSEHFNEHLEWIQALATR